MDVLKPTRFGRTLSTSSRQSREERNGEFFRFVDQTSHIGCDGYNNSVKFNSPSTLRKWWEQAGENRIARARNSGCSSVTTIRNNYLIIFSILVYINKTQFISEFIKLGWQDQQLPLLEDDRRRFGEDPDMTDMLHNFCDYQWRFCPVVFSKESRMDERVLNPRQILPIEMQADLGSPITNAKSIIRRVKLYDDCCDPKWCHCTTIVLKEYQTRKNEALRDAWHQEHNAFVSIETFDNIIKYLGSFEQDGRCFIAMEYANGGSLRDLFKKNIRPKTTQEEVCFWNALMGLFRAINHIHNLGPRMDGERIAFAHRDINPTNILVFQDDKEPFSESFRLKLADFDASTTTQPRDHTGLGSHDNNGSRTYSAPEASRFYIEQEGNLMQLPFNGDVWSLGCVLSVALVWLSGGMAAIEATEQHRKTTIKTCHPHIDGSGYEACFHDGKNVLPCVLESHRVALSTLQPTDTFSRGVRDLIEKQILVPKGSRSDPMDIWAEFNALVRSASLGAWGQTFSDVTGGPSSPKGPSRDPPPIHLTHYEDNGKSVEIYRPPEPRNQNPPVSNVRAVSPPVEMFSNLTVEDVLSHRQWGSKKEDLPGYKKFRTGIQSRHFILIIDDSESMRRREKEVCRTAEALLWILKEIDSEGVEVRFTSDPSRRYPARTWSMSIMRPATKQLMKLIWKRLKYSESDRWCNMELALNTILNDQVVQPGRPTSVLILTDGMWGPGSGSRSRKEQGATLNSAVEETFLDVLRQMERKGMKRTDFSIQFVSFGNDPVGLRQLDYLDDEAPYLAGNGRRIDIVDHKGSGDNIWAILWGAVNEYNDAIRTSSIRNGVEGS